MRRVPDALDLVALVDGRPAATGSVTAIGDVAWLGGAATLEPARGRGLQTALLAERLHRARELGCTLAAVTALPAITSSRNILRAGFQLLYTQTVMTQS
jgi:GNAT superfamily N-acetyltransferase